MHVPGLHSEVRSARLLDGGQKLTTTATDAGVTVMLPAKVPDAIASVIVLELEGKLNVDSIVLK